MTRGPRLGWAGDDGCLEDGGDGAAPAPASVSIRPTRTESGETLVRNTGAPRGGAGWNVRSELRSVKGEKEGLLGYLQALYPYLACPSPNQAKGQATGERGRALG